MGNNGKDAEGPGALIMPRHQFEAYLVGLRKKMREHLEGAVLASAKWNEENDRIDAEVPDGVARRVRKNESLIMGDAQGGRMVHTSIANLYANAILAEVAVREFKTGGRRGI